jgi:hypothetical protein
MRIAKVCPICNARGIELFDLLNLAFGVGAKCSNCHRFAIFRRPGQTLVLALLSASVIMFVFFSPVMYALALLMLSFIVASVVPLSARDRAKARPKATKLSSS